MALSPQWLDELRARVTLSSVIQRTTKLQRAGNEWKACCPFHDEKTPSFTVSDAKGFYHCFGCGAHGDVIRWMTDQRGLSFMDAVKELAAEAGMELPALDPRTAHRAEQQAGLHEVVQAAQSFFRASLDTPAGAVARAYLKSRGFDAHTEERFGFGYAPGGRGTIAAALSRFPTAMLVEAGLLIEADGKAPYDRFRDRLTMPIHDPRGQVIGFAARILDAGKTDAPKYINSPDTPLFDKGRTLFNLHRAGPASRKSGRLVVVEGQMDVVALAAAGFEEAVAPMGTALTERQLELLWRLVDAPILCFDGDSAGQRAAMRAIARALPLLAPGKSLAFVHLPAGEDPDDFLKLRGARAFEQLLANPTTMLDALWDFERSAAPTDTPERKAGLRARLLEHVEEIADRDIRALYRRDLLDLFYAFAYPPRKGLGQAGGRFAADLSPEISLQLKDFADGGSRQSFARAVLAGLAKRPHLIWRYVDDLRRFKPMHMGYAAALDILSDTSDLLEQGQTPPLAALQQIRADRESRYFPFLRDGVREDYATDCLDEAVRLLIARPAAQEELERANALYQADVSSANEALQREARARLEKHDQRLRDFWRKWHPPDADGDA